MDKSENEHGMTGELRSKNPMMALVGRCGLYCGACPSYLGSRGDEDARIFVKEKWEIPEEKISCNGCNALTPESVGANCKMVPCLDAKGYGYCSECAEYADGSCEKFEVVESFLKKLGESARDNLRRINSGETDAGLAEQEKRWRCPSCGSPVFWQATICSRCQEPL
jgi:hypothetical protein